ncbi:peptide/nickel transport system permease protein [Tamaricihabitans halophyticus]|uniref:Peptide/nickel transport system permease protein n=1 Tax=Tamaricihabitans halophyticus TaxID=1262583 RepID=A0A4R2Q905_9PSEU|nr:ABC transporter permease [Tamaricihabitans halophyticus]TCP45049.1 peptide/nickel transport system permease protein [Tamaricihabitans halophyticus]
MLRYTIDKLLTAFPLLVLVALGTFGLVFLMPGDAAVTIAGEGASAAQIQTVRQDLGLDQPVLVQFWDWFQGVLVGDFGTSYSYNASVSYLITQRIEVTVSLVVVGLLFASVAGTVIGLFAGLNPGGPFDRVTTLLVTLGLAAPTYWIAIVFIIVFSLQLGWFDATGYVSITESPGGWLHSILLPAAAVSVTSIADVSRQVRATASGVKDLDFVRTGRALGIPRSGILVRHIGRNSGVATITIIGLQVERLIGAAVVIEMLFAMPGFGTLLVNAVLNQDLPVIQISVLLIASVVILTNLAVDISYGLINPKIRTG